METTEPEDQKDGRKLHDFYNYEVLLFDKRSGKQVEGVVPLCNALESYLHDIVKEIDEESNS